MGGRYYITGVQLGIITASIGQLDFAQVCKTLIEVKENQFIGNVENPRLQKVAIVEADGHG